MTSFLVVVSLLIVIVGTLELTNATLGVGVICIGCYFGILARIYQSSCQHQETPESNSL